MTADEFQAVCDSLPPDEDHRNTTSLVNELVRRKRLTKYQAARLCHGNIEGLSYGNYIVLDELGAGGMGVVFRAEHRRMKRVVALKVLPAEMLKSEIAVQRFHREVEAAAKLTHPNIVAAYDADESDGVHFLVMEYVGGENFTQTVRRRGPMAVDRAIDLCLQTARGLVHAHERGIVHRDIKPSNLLIDPEGIVKILDMGLARVRAADDSDVAQEDLTQSGRVMGTVDYMAPEQALDAKRADHRADIYSLGCTLYFLLTGDVLSPPGAMTKKLLWHQTGKVPSLCELRQDVPPLLDETFQKMLAKTPEERQQSMTEVIANLTTCLEEVGGAMTQIDFPSGSHGAADIPTLVSGPLGGVTLADKSAVRATPARPKSGIGVFVGVAAVFAVLAVIGFAMFGGVSPSGSSAEAPAPSAPGDPLPFPSPPSEDLPSPQPGDQPSDPTPTVPPPDEPSAAERLANWVHTYGGALTLLTADGTRLDDVTSAEDLPKGDYTVRGVNLEGQTLRGAEWDLLAESRSVESVSLAETDVDNKVVGKLAAMPALRRLDLGTTAIDDDALALLADAKQLEWLNVRGTAVTDSGMPAVAALVALRDVYLSDTAVTDAGLKPLQDLVALRSVALNGTKVTGEGVLTLKAARPSLGDVVWDAPDHDRIAARHVLQLGGKVNVQAMANGAVSEVTRLADLTSDPFVLKGVDLGGLTAAGDVDLAMLKPLLSIDAINLAGTSVTGEGLGNLEGLASLRTLNLGGIPFAPDEVAALRAELADCQVEWHPIDDRSIAAWVIEHGGTVSLVTDDGEAFEEQGDVDALPASRFALRQVRLERCSDPLGPLLAMLVELRRLESLILIGSSLDDNGAADLASVAPLEELQLSDTKVSDKTLAALEQLPNLRKLFLARTGVTDAGLASLARHAGLLDLSLAETAVTDKGAEQLGRLTQLGWLDLSRTDVSDASLGVLSSLRGLQWLDLRGTSLSDAGGEELAATLADCDVAVDALDVQRLVARWIIEQRGQVTLAGKGELLNIDQLPREACVVEKFAIGGDAKFDEQALAWLASCGSASTIDLTGANLTDAQIKFLVSCPRVGQLSLAQTRISDAGLEALTELVGLNVLSLAGTPVDGSGLVHIHQDAPLVRLALSEARLTSEGLKAVKRFADLEILDLSYNMRLDDEGVKPVVEALPMLTALKLRSTRVGDETLESLQKCPELRTLDLASTRVTDGGLAALAELEKLEDLDLQGLPLTDGAVGALGQLGSLKKLNLVGTQIKDEQIDSLREQMPETTIRH
jgi:serine/threonine protein kinase